MAEVNDTVQEGQVGGLHEVSFDELEEQYNEARKPAPPAPEPEKPDPVTAKLEEIKQQFGMLSTPQPAPAPAPAPAAPAPAPEPTLTVEQLRELYEQDPLQAVAAMVEMGRKQARQEIEQTLSPLLTGNENIAKMSARQKYADEFKLFENEINQHAAQIADKRLLANPQTWDTIVTYVRGQNMDKLIDSKVAAALEAAQVLVPKPDPATTVPPTVRSSRSAGGDPTNNNYGLTEAELRVCRVQGITPADYKRYKGGR